LQIARAWSGTALTYLLLLALIALLPARSFLPADRLYVDVATSFAAQYAALALLVPALIAAFTTSSLTPSRSKS
jgi:hypothetical protein